jgi:BlaI family transcriptional regulator, penicillinase repressor
MESFMTKTPPRLGRVQLQILQILWRLGPSTARQILDEMSKSTKIARSTVQTLLRQLQSKNIVAHTEQSGGVFLFYAVSKESEIVDTATDDLLTRVFQGSLYNLVAHLLQPEHLSQDELDRLRDLIESKRKDTKDRR